MVGAQFDVEQQEIVAVIRMDTTGIFLIGHSLLRKEIAVDVIEKLSLDIVAYYIMVTDVESGGHHLVSLRHRLCTFTDTVGDDTVDDNGDKNEGERSEDEVDSYG